jgi:predicted NUDIX family phosphoesterase
MYRVQYDDKEKDVTQKLSIHVIVTLIKGHVLTEVTLEGTTLPRLLATPSLSQNQHLSHLGWEGRKEVLLAALDKLIDEGLVFREGISELFPLYVRSWCNL